MSTAIHLDPVLVPHSLRGNYSGRKFKAIVCETVTIPADAGLWDGGSRDIYYAARLFETVDLCRIPGQETAPWNGARRDTVVTLQPGQVIVQHSHFCGSDMGLTFYVHPQSATRFLPAPVELSPYERLILTATSSLKSSYGGRDRYENAQGEYHCRKAMGDTATYPSRAEWDEAKSALVSKGYLNKAGAITVSGKNAIAR